MTTTTGPTALPDGRGYFGEFGGRYVPETLMPALAELEAAYEAARADDAFAAELDDLLATYAGRPTALTRARRLEERLGGEGAPRIYLKREDLAHTGAHKINAALAQGLLARRMGKPASSPRPAPASMAWPRRRPARCSASSASSTWAPRMCGGRRSTSSG